MDRSILDSELNTETTSKIPDANSTFSNQNKKTISSNQPQVNQNRNQLHKLQLHDLYTSLFPKQQFNSIINCLTLKTWNLITPRDQLLDPMQHEQIHLKTPFPTNDKINHKIALWVGDITNLDCQVIVHSTNENFCEDTPATRVLYNKAGYELFNYLTTNVRCCKTGDVKITSGFGLNCRYIFHTVGPKYKEKFHTAAESALFNCYFKVLDLMREYKLTTLALCPINTIRRGYPFQDAAHIAMRTLRRFLEKYSDEVQRIVLVVNDLDIGIYESVLPLYFPRCENEEIYACYKLSEDIGGINGEPILPERQIRILENPIKFSISKQKKNENDKFPRSTIKTFKTNEDLAESIDLVSGLESSVIVGKTSFAKMKTDVDRKWLLQHGMYGKCPVRNADFLFENSNNSNNSSLSKSNLDESKYRLELNRRMRYNILLRQAKSSDHNEIMKLRWLYVNGVDRLGRTLIVLIGSHLQADYITLEKALLYFIYQMDKIKDREYTVVYFHSNTDKINNIPLNFLRYIYDTVDLSYKRNLNAIYVVHPTIWFKVMAWWFTKFSAHELKNKVITIKSLLNLDSVLELQHLKIPQSILDLDFKLNGNRYIAEDATEHFY